ncbi:MAG: hypothetical protein PHP98_10275 [Kiritimatiellae bacterium]|nr:hypothetical protein [Kiritimatiellia bacterium]
MADLVVPLKIIAQCLAILCLILAVLLLVCPGVFSRINRVSKIWFPTERLEKELNRTRDIDAQLLKIRRILGVIALALAFVFLLISLK